MPPFKPHDLRRSVAMGLEQMGIGVRLCDCIGKVVRKVVGPRAGLPRSPTNKCSFEDAAANASCTI
jgi:hypothetical protein